MEEIAQQKTSMQTDSLIKTLQIRDIKEAIYISQLDYLSDWLIAFVTLLFGISIISQLFTFEARIKRISDQYEEQKTANENYIKDVEKRFKNQETENENLLEEIKKSERDIWLTHAKVLQIRRDELYNKGKYFEAVEVDYQVINILTRVIELDGNSDETNVHLFWALREYLCHMEKMYETMNENSRSMFFYYADDKEQLKEYFNTLYTKVYEPSREIIMEIKSKLQERAVKAREIQKIRQEAEAAKPAEENDVQST